MINESYDKQIKHLVAVDIVLFGYENGQLKLLCFKRHLEPNLGKWSLIGGWLYGDESADDAAKRVLKKITGLDDIFMEQIHVFSHPERDTGGRVLSVVYYALVDIKKHDKSLIHRYSAEWHTVKDQPNLIFDHNSMVELALSELQQKASYHIVGRDLLPEEFTIIQLRHLYNSIFFREFDPGNFRKKILSLKAIYRLDKKDTSESKKGAFFYKFKPIDEIDISIRIVK